MSEEKQAEREAQDARRHEPQQHELHDGRPWEGELKDLDVGDEPAGRVRGGGGGNWTG